MTFRNMNEPDQHDGTRHEWNFGGPFEVVIRVNGEQVYAGEPRKGDRLMAHFKPKGEYNDE